MRHWAKKRTRFLGFFERRQSDLNRWIRVLQTHALPLGYVAIYIFVISFVMTPTGIEPVLPPWKGDVLTAWPWSRSLYRVSRGSLGLPHFCSCGPAPRVGLEPTTTRLTAECSTIELSRKNESPAENRRFSRRNLWFLLYPQNRTPISSILHSFHPLPPADLFIRLR